MKPTKQEDKKVVFYFNFETQTLCKALKSEENTILGDNIYFTNQPHKALELASRIYSKGNEPNNYPCFRFDYTMLKIVGEYESSEHEKSTSCFSFPSRALREAAHHFKSLGAYDIGGEKNW